MVEGEMRSCGVGEGERRKKRESSYRRKRMKGMVWRLKWRGKEKEEKGEGMV